VPAHDQCLPKRREVVVPRTRNLSQIWQYIPRFPVHFGKASCYQLSFGHNIRIPPIPHQRIELGLRPMDLLYNSRSADYTGSGIRLHILVLARERQEGATEGHWFKRIDRAGYGDHNRSLAMGQTRRRRNRRDNPERMGKGTRTCRRATEDGPPPIPHSSCLFRVAELIAAIGERGK